MFQNRLCDFLTLDVTAKHWTFNFSPTTRLQVQKKQLISAISLATV